METLRASSIFFQAPGRAQEVDATYFLKEPKGRAAIELLAICSHAHTEPKGSGLKWPTGRGLWLHVRRETIWPRLQLGRLVTSIVLISWKVTSNEACCHHHPGLTRPPLLPRARRLAHLKRDTFAHSGLLELSRCHLVVIVQELAGPIVLDELQNVLWLRWEEAFAEVSGLRRGHTYSKI